MRKLLLGAATSLFCLLAPISASADLYADGWTAYHAKNYGQAIDLWRKSIQAGDTRAYYKLGTLYAEGEHVEQSDKQAAYWYEMSANTGSKGAQYLTGTYYRDGKGVRQSNSKAKYWFKKAAAQGDYQAKTDLAALEKSEQDRLPTTASNPLPIRVKAQPKTKAYTRRVLLAHSASFGSALNLQEQGKHTQAITIFTELAAKGNLASQLAMGINYKTGNGVPQSYSEAMRWFKMASYNEASQFADILNNGRKSQAETAIAVMYMDGKGVPKSETKFSFWIERAAHHGSKRAQIVTGDNYYVGDVVEKNKTMAIYWYEKAGNQGLAQAQYMVGEMYRFGEGRPISKLQALSWYNKAAAQGHERAKTALKEMGG